MKKIIQIIFSLLSIVIGLYPLAYLFNLSEFGLFFSKNIEILSSVIWNISFYSHIIPGGIALLIGWIQFNDNIRSSKPKLHKTIGKIYVLTVLISGISGIYIGFFATGGVISSLGFIALAILWMYTTSIAFWYAKTLKIHLHQTMMYYSYAACFAAVTLRIWLPFLVMSIGDFIVAYRIVAWLCWVPNLIVAYYLVRRIKHKFVVNQNANL
ncbi:DUF2306 domain-containing protein [Aquimarina sediminis]|uniref:DUF2306 domain-containing protein n=1 Tax=Aquimarina sediminis TaxID=2070536 RepID=UPI000CA07641|nr:DUF2306 domain-containing protein [Aquimarina sediminis]